MQIRMIFGTIVAPSDPAGEPQDLKCGSLQTVEDALAEQLIKDGRAEPFVAPAKPAEGK